MFCCFFQFSFSVFLLKGTAKLPNNNLRVYCKLFQQNNGAITYNSLTSFAVNLHANLYMSYISKMIITGQKGVNLSIVIPNRSGPKKIKSRVLKSVAHTIMLYAAPDG